MGPVGMRLLCTNLVSTHVQGDTYAERFSEGLERERPELESPEAVILWMANRAGPRRRDGTAEGARASRLPQAPEQRPLCRELRSELASPTAEPWTVWPWGLHPLRLAGTPTQTYLTSAGGPIWDSTPSTELPSHSGTPWYTQEFCRSLEPSDSLRSPEMPKPGCLYPLPFILLAFTRAFVLGFRSSRRWTGDLRWEVEAPPQKEEEACSLAGGFLWQAGSRHFAFSVPYLEGLDPLNFTHFGEGGCPGLRGKTGHEHFLDIGMGMHEALPVRLKYKGPPTGAEAKQLEGQSSQDLFAQEPVPPGSGDGALQDALLSLGSVIDIAGLQQAVKEALSAVLPKVETVYTYLLDGESRLVCEEPPHELPQEGKVREAVISRKRLGCNGLGPSDLPGKPLARLVAPLAPDTQVLVIPLVDKEAGAVAAVILVHCGQLSDNEEWSLQAVEKHTLVALKRVQALQQRESSVAPEATQNPPEEAAGDQKGGVAYTDQDRKILQLCGELYDLDASSLQLKVLQYLQQETQASRCCLLLVSEDNLQLSCKVIGDKVLEEEISFPLTTGRLGQVVEDKKSIQLKDLTSEDVQQLQSMLGCEVQAMLCVPVISRATDQVVALACAFNKLGGDLFTDQDEHMIQHCFHYTSTVLTSTLAFQKEQKLKCECQALLQVAKNLFTHLDDVSVLLQEIITEARNLSNAEICSVFLLDQNELVAKVFDGGVVEDESYEIRIPADQGIAGHVATTGQILNIPDAYAHPLFYRGVDDSTGFRTRNILCFPIKNENQEVIGVAELVNKINGPWFSKFDEDLATAFSIYCGISIAHSLLYKKVNEAQYRSHLANEMMMYHMKVSDDEYTKLLHDGIQPVAAIDSNFASFTYTPRSLPEDDTSMAILSMLQDMNFINNYKIDCPTLARFCLMVKKGYRDPPYHNWMHAFSVSHFCYLLYKNLELTNYLEDMEIFALFISCMCHDLDHRGTNNSFQVASKSVLAALYSSEGSVMERHHFAQAIAILNTHGCNIFDHFSRKDYQRMLDLMRDIILATDLAHHLRIFKDLQKMAEVGYDRTNKQHHNLLLCLLMTSCDLSDQTKGWKTTRKIAELIYKEFFSQGDLEKAMGNRPMEMMDREKAYIPELQISFMEHIAMPIYKLLQDLFPKAAELYERVASNREHWTKVSHKFTIRGLPSNNSLDFLDEEYEVPDLDGARAPINGCCSLDAE
nr:PREDICTED: cGMP-dependent 3',5'-cyclic phosphodiesterase [Bos mutus]